MKIDAFESIYTMLRCPKVRENHFGMLDRQNICLLLFICAGTTCLICVRAIKPTINHVIKPAETTQAVRSSLQKFSSILVHILTSKMIISILKIYLEIVLQYFRYFVIVVCVYFKVLLFSFLCSHFPALLPC